MRPLESFAAGGETEGKRLPGPSYPGSANSERIREGGNPKNGKTPPEAPIKLLVDVGGAYSEVEIPESEMPPAVAVAVKKLYPTGRIQEVKRETRKGGKIVYAIELFVDGKQYDVEATPAGEVLRNEAD